MSTLRIFLLGPPRIVRAEKRVSDHLSQKALGLLTYMIVGSSYGYTREHLAGLFWSETNEDHANFNLRRAFWSLRKAITLPTEPTDAYIRYEERRYSFDRASDYWVDASAFESAVNKWPNTCATPFSCSSSSRQHSSSPDLNELRDAIHLYRGEFLESCGPRGCPEFFDWMILERDRLRQQLVRGLLALAGEVAEQGDYQQAISYYRQLLRVDPLNEAAHRALMVIYHVLGEQEASLGIYYSFCRMIREQLELEPTPAIQALFRDIRKSVLMVEKQSYRQRSARKTASQAAKVSPFVGRKQEQNRLWELLESVLHAGSCLTVVTGEAGIGKTRLVEEFLRHISGFRFTVLRATCYAQQRDLPYQPVVEALRGHLSTADLSYIERLSNLWLTEVAKLLPELYDYLPSLRASPSLLPNQERNRLYEGLAQLIIHLSKQRPLILFLDNFHVADEPTLNLIHYLSRRLASDRVLILCALRQEALASHTSLAELLNTRDDGSRRLATCSLTRLSETEVLELVQRMLGTSSKPTALTHQLYLRTDGNPFLLVEMLKAHLEGQEVFSQESTVPANIRDFVQRRMARLDDECRRLLRIGAVLGHQFNSSVLQRIYHEGEKNLLNVLDRLLDQGWIVEIPTADPGTYDFSHGLVREAIYQTLKVDRRSRLHRQVGLALERITGENDELAGTLAQHFSQAGDDCRTVLYSLKAADRAQRICASQEAIAHYQRVMGIVSQNPAILSEAEQLEIQCQLGQAFEFLGEYETAINTYRESLNTLDPTQPKHHNICFRLAMTHDRRGEYDQALKYLGTIATHLSEAGDSMSRLNTAMIARGKATVHLHRGHGRLSLVFCEQALALIGHGAVSSEEMPLANQMASERVEVYGIMADSHFYLGNYEMAKSHYQQALDMARRQDRRPAIARLLIGLGKVNRRQGNYAQAEAYARKSLDLCHGIGHMVGEAASLGLLGNVAYNRGELEEVASCYKLALSLSRRLGDKHGIANYCLSIAYVQIDQDEIDEAESYLQEALSIGQSIGATLIVIRAHYHQAQIARARGNMGGAQAFVEKALEAVEQEDVPFLLAVGHQLLGEILAQRGHHAQAEDHFVESLRLFESLGARFDTARILRNHAQILTEQGDFLRARAQLQHAAAIFAGLGSHRELVATEARLTSKHPARKETAFETTAC